MRMERINEHQVRCMITNQDLAAHKITSNDLKYGSKEMQELFREMLKKAADQYHFNEEGLPVMIEAIPVNVNELLIIISAVEDADELDPHFANFRNPSADKPDQGLMNEDRLPDLRYTVFYFEGFNAVISFCHAFPLPSVRTELYAGTEPHTYYLAVLRPEDMNKVQFVQFVNSLNELGETAENGAEIYEYMKEHSEPVMLNPHLILAGL